MDIYYIILVSLIFTSIVVNLISNKKLSLISFFMFCILVLLIVIYKVDNDYYLTITKDISNINNYLIVISFLVLLISLLEFMVSSKIKNKKENIKTYETESIEQCNNDNNDIKYYFEMLDFPIAYLKDNKYILNGEFQKILSFKNDVLSKEELYSLINDEDKNRDLDDLSSKIFRFKKCDNSLWFEMTSIIINECTYKIIKAIKNSPKQLIQRPFKDLVNIIDESKIYGVVIINIVNYSKIKYNHGSDYLNLAIKKYIMSLCELSFMQKDNVFYLNPNEYVFVLNSKTEYDCLLEEIDSECSSIISQEIEISKMKIKIEAKIGIVRIDDVRKNDEELLSEIVIEKMFEVIKLASSIDYLGDYAIYQNVNLTSLTSDEYIIDLDLDQFHNRLK